VITEPGVVLEGGLVPMVVLVGDVDGTEPVVVSPAGSPPVALVVVGWVLAVPEPTVCLDGPVLNGLAPEVLVVVVVGNVDGAEPVAVGWVLAVLGPNNCLDGPVLNGLAPEVLVVVVVGNVDGAEPVAVGLILAVLGPNNCLGGPVLNGLAPEVLIVVVIGNVDGADCGVPVLTVGGLLVVTFGGLKGASSSFDGGLGETVAPTTGTPALSIPAVSGLSSCDVKLPSGFSPSVNISPPSTVDVPYIELSSSLFTDESLVLGTTVSPTVGCGGVNTCAAHCFSLKLPLNTLNLFCPATFPGKKYLATTNTQGFCFCIAVATPKPTFVLPFHTS
jgi:hypothetical protein